MKNRLLLFSLQEGASSFVVQIRPENAPVNNSA